MACDGYINLHSGNFKISHNDIKPGNIMVDYENGILTRVGIIDFGTSSIM